MKKFQLIYSRKASVIRIALAAIICIFSAILIHNEFSLFLLILVLGMVGFLFLLKLFWKGMDDGTFFPLYSNENIEKRDKIIRLLSVIISYFSAITILFYIDEKTSYIIGGFLILLCIIESILFFR